MLRVVFYKKKYYSGQWVNLFLKWCVSFGEDSNYGEKTFCGKLWTAVYHCLHTSILINILLKLVDNAIKHRSKNHCNTQRNLGVANVFV